MNTASLHSIAEKLIEGSKGILAADESSATIKKRFEKIGIEDTPEMHRKYRQLLFYTPEIEKYISGVILYDETFRQKNDQGQLFPDYLAEIGVLPGIKVDMGKVPMPMFPDEFVTEGLDGLRERLKEYSDKGAKFTKWRAVINIGLGRPSSAVIHANAHALARYAALVQEAGMVPIVEPEVLMDGDHDIDQCEIVTSLTLDEVFSELIKAKVDLKGMLLKPNMVLSGKDNEKKDTSEEIRDATLRTFTKAVPAEVPGIVFLSGGQSQDEAVRNLCVMNKNRDYPWALSFSYGRALQNKALNDWAGKDENVIKAQESFLEYAKLDSEAREGIC